jgi:CRP/FNR family transcriptional regulator, cyclic AMP receptor protein
VADHGERHAGTPASGPGWLVIPPDSFLGMLTDNQRSSLLGLGSNTIYRPGQIIMREGNPGNAVVVILRGLARVAIHSEDGKEVLLGFRSSGDLIGEMAVMSSSTRLRSATVAAVTELRGNFIGAASFVAYLERSPQVARRVSDIISDKLRAASRRRLEYNAYPAEVRLACILAEVALTYGYAEGATWRIGPEITQADLASLGSVSVRTIEKILRIMEGRGMVARHRRDLIITDLAALQARCRSLSATRPGRDSLPC